LILIKGGVIVRAKEFWAETRQAKKGIVIKRRQKIKIEFLIRFILKNRKVISKAILL
jgi:hypothetical protein